MVHLSAAEIEAVIPPRINRRVQLHVDENLYKNRNLVERFLLRIKHFHRIATHYDKQADCFASFVASAAVVIWLA